MAAANTSSEKIDLLVYGPIRPILENGFSDQFVLHKAESRADLERLTPDVLAKTRGMAVTYHTVPADKKSLSHFPKLEIVASFGVGYDHVDSAYAREQNIVVTNTPDVLTEEVADVAMGLCGPYTSRSIFSEEIAAAISFPFQAHFHASAATSDAKPAPAAYK